MATTAITSDLSQIKSSSKPQTKTSSQSCNDESQSQYCNLLHSQRGEKDQIKNNLTIDQQNSSTQNRILQLENMKTLNSTYRPRSNDKISTQLIPPNGSTGGSTSFSAAINLLKKPSNMLLNTGPTGTIINQQQQQSISTPQNSSTQNQHSNRFSSYNQPIVNSTSGTSTFQASSQGASSIPSTVDSISSQNNLHSARQATSQTPKGSLTIQQSQNQVNNFNGAQSLISQQNKSRQNSQNIPTQQQPQQITHVLKKQNSNAMPLLTQDLQNFLPNSQNLENASSAKVGTSVPKSTTAANLKNFNNLRQFNQIFNSNRNNHQLSPTNYQQLHQQHQSQENCRKPMEEQKVSQNSDSTTSQSESSKNSQKPILSNHQRHIQQQLQNKTQLHRPKGSQDLTSALTLNGGEKPLQFTLPSQRINPKNLEIAIPTSPRESDQYLPQSEKSSIIEPKIDQEPSSSELKKQDTQSKPPNTTDRIRNTIHSGGSLSTTNADKGNIKLNKFTCNSTRNASQKPIIFKNGKEEQSSNIGQSRDASQSNNIQSSQQTNNNNGQSQNGGCQLQPAHKIIIPNHETTKHSLKRNGVVRAYAANTNQGLVRNYNEDRVSIILNILKPSNRPQNEVWPRCSFFGIYDGHGGAACADYLRDNLHQFVIREQTFPSNPKEALRNGFFNAEKKFIELAQNENGIIDKSGSCAIVVLIVEDQCYVANVGDSRALLSAEQGNKIYPLSRDHKPNDELERKRIVEAGGQIYHRTATQAMVDQSNPQSNSSQLPKQEIVVGPLRVLPGRLSVSRTFGDAEAKISKFGGNPKVVISDPEIKQFKITKDHDFIVLGCDGIFDKLNNQDTMACVWNSVKDNKQLQFANNIHKQSGMGVEYILKNSLLRRTLDNVTVVLIAFSNFKHACFGRSETGGPLGQGTLDSITGNISNRTGANKNSSLHSADTSQIMQNKHKLNSSSLIQSQLQSSVETQKRKENIPPDNSSTKDLAHQQTMVPKTQQTIQQQLQSSKSKGSLLSINTNGNCQNQGLKSTTNAQLQAAANNQQLLQSQGLNSKKLSSGSILGPGGSNTTTNTLKQRHFDFSHV